MLHDISLYPDPIRKTSESRLDKCSDSIEARCNLARLLVPTWTISRPSRFYQLTTFCRLQRDIHRPNITMERIRKSVNSRLTQSPGGAAEVCVCVCDGVREKQTTTNCTVRARYECEIRAGPYWRITCGRGGEQIVCSISGRQFSAVYIRLSIGRRHHSLPITICNGRRKSASKRSIRRTRRADSPFTPARAVREG